MRLIPFILLCLAALASCQTNPESTLETEASADTVTMREHLVVLTKTEQPRNFRNRDQLIRTSAYIYDVFERYADSVSFQNYTVSGNTYRNVIGVFGPPEAKRLVIGAHYDVCDNQEGADDNASGVVGLLELARLLHGQPLTHRIELVAYCLEEPPYFATEDMGSYIHAKSLHDQQADVLGMVCLEMIGYFKEEKGTQDYPLGMLSWFYGSRGNYIALVKRMGGGAFAKKFAKRFANRADIRSKSINAPAALPGIDLSDHRNYWHFGYSALMITDTAFFRNKNYHRTTDTLETLNLPKMGQVIDGVFRAVMSLQG